jgi:hypothetical protein
MRWPGWGWGPGSERSRSGASRPRRAGRNRRGRAPRLAPPCMSRCRSTRAHAQASPSHRRGRVQRAGDRRSAVKARFVGDDSPAASARRAPTWGGAHRGARPGYPRATLLRWRPGRGGVEVTICSMSCAAPPGRCMPSAIGRAPSGEDTVRGRVIVVMLSAVGRNPPFWGSPLRRSHGYRDTMVAARSLHIEPEGERRDCSRFRCGGERR